MRKLYFLVGAGLLLAVLSCTREELPASGLEDGLERVNVTLNLKVPSYEDGTPETKAIMEPEEGASSPDDQIANFVVLQFNGVTESAQLVGGQVYKDHWPLYSTLNPSDPAYDGTDVVTLKASDSPCTVVVLANTFDRVSITSGTTLGTFLQKFSAILSLSGVFTTSGGNDYLRMSGSIKLDNVTAGTSVNVSLKRNVAKIIVNVTNNTSSANPQVNISKVQLRDINAKYYYLTHINPALTSLTFTDPYSDVNPHRFDNDQEDFPAEKNPGGASAGTPQQYMYYIPANLRGTTTNTYQYSKGNGAPRGSTYFRLSGTYPTSNNPTSNIPINYTYYLGGNLTNDFNLRPNYKYTYNITINSKGDANYDYRIEDMGEVKFATDANCYMLHPPEVSGQSRIYAIPVRRAAVFWNPEGTNLGVYGASTLSGYGSGYTWDSGTDWTAEVLWSDFQLDPSQFLQVSSGKGFDPTNPAHTNPYFKVKVDSGMKGNVVVGVKVNGIILWSWHLWITEYDPDRYVVPVEHQYIYGVGEGEVHRYNNILFNITLPTESQVGYKNGFVMDRNLGALATTPNSYLSYGLFYQYGRKDPFTWGTASGSENEFFLGGNAPAVPVLTPFGIDPENRSIRCDNSFFSADSYKNIRYTITHPMVFIYGYGSASMQRNWTVADDDLGDDGDKNNSRWNDRKFWEHAGNDAALEIKKSIYDPCPPGWKLPIDGGIWSGFRVQVGEEDTYTSDWNDGRYYYPEGYVNRETTGAIYYPYTGDRSGESGRIYFSNSAVNYWSSDFNSSQLGFHLSFSTSRIINAYGGPRTNGFPVRCVRE